MWVDIDLEMDLQSSDPKLAKQASAAFEALLDILGIQMDHAACFGLQKTYAEQARCCIVEAALHALASGENCSDFVDCREA